MKPLQRQERGIAIIIVIAVLAALIALTAPFIFSMILHERSARGSLQALQAREGSEAAVAHALAHLARNIRHDPNDPRPHITTLRDLKVTMDFPSAGKTFNNLNVNMQNPSGLVASARIEDEQAKINLNSAPPPLLGNLLGSSLLVEPANKSATELVVDDPYQFYTDGDATTTDGTVCVGGDWVPYKHVSGGAIYLEQGLLFSHTKGTLVYDGRARQIADHKFRQGGADFVPFRSIYEVKTALDPKLGQPLAPDDFARIERMVTINSGREGAVWGHAERPREQSFQGNLRSFRLEKGAGYTPGTLIRVVQGGVPRTYARVQEVTLQNDGSAFLLLDGEIGITVNSTGQGDDVYLEPELKHPINLNTASPEVIASVVMGVCLKQGAEPVTRTNALDLAAFLTRGNIIYHDQQEFREVLDKALEARVITAQQRDAIYINATEPNSPKLRTSTVPFCYHSCGTYTIEGAAVLNNDNGLQLARHAVRQLVSMPTPWPGRFEILNQIGFQELLDNGEGLRVVTGPVAMGRFRYQWGKNIPTPRTGSINLGGVRLDVGECAERLTTAGASAPRQQNAQSSEFIEHCEDERDPGFRMDGYDMTRRNHFTIGPPQVLRPQQNLREPGSPPMSVEMWYKPLQDTAVTFFEHGMEEDRNRVVFHYDPRDGMKVTIWDAGLERKKVETTFPCRLTTMDWHHVAASWKGSYLLGQEIRLDGRLYPYDSQPIQRNPASILVNDLSLEEFDSLEVESDDMDGFPTMGAIRIGEEIIEYGLKQGNTLRNLRRGARMSAVAKHNSGEFIIPFGYSNRLAQTLRVGGATLTSAVRPGQIMARVNRPPPPLDIGFCLESDTTIKVVDASDFPQSGYIVCNGELMYYGQRDATNFRQVQRGLTANGVSAPARNLNHNAQIHLVSIEVSDHSQYDQVGIVQIDDDTDNTRVEWIGYGSKTTQSGKNYLVAEFYNPPPVNSAYQVGNPPTTRQGPRLAFRHAFRGRFGIGQDRGHARGAKVIPVFRVRGPHCGDQQSPYGMDGISTCSVVEYGSSDGDLRYVKQAYTHQWANVDTSVPNNPRFINWQFDYFVGLDDFVSRDYQGETTRLLKWPSGELPDLVNIPRQVCGDRNGEGKLEGYVDEIRASVHNSIGARIAMTIEGTGIDTDDVDIIVEDVDAWPSNNPENVQMNWPLTGGLIRIENEFIWYETARVQQIEYYADVWPDLKEKPPEKNKADRRWRAGTRNEHHPNIKQKQALLLTGCKRAQFGTEAVEHPVGATIALYDGMAVTSLSGNLLPTSDTINLKDTRGFPREGYVWIGEEVISYQELAGNTLRGCAPFHGCFGTPEEAHESGEVVRLLPYRYWDRASEFYDGRGQALLQAGYATNDAVWDGIQIETKAVENSHLPSRCRPYLLVRFDGKPGWDTEPLNQEGSLYKFDVRNNAPIKLSGAGPNGIKADQIEVRVYWQYQRGAFQTSPDWKRTFDLTRLRATYYSPMIMRRLDELERR